LIHTLGRDDTVGSETLTTTVQGATSHGEYNAVVRAVLTCGACQGHAIEVRVISGKLAVLPLRASSASKDSVVVGRGDPGRAKRARVEAGGDEAGDGGVWDGVNRTTAKRKSLLEKSMLIIEQSHSGGR